MFGQESLKQLILLLFLLASVSNRLESHQQSVWLITIILLRRIKWFMLLPKTNKVKFNQINLMLLTKHYYLFTTGMYLFPNCSLLWFNLSFSFWNEIPICNYIIPFWHCVMKQYCKWCRLWNISLYITSLGEICLNWKNFFAKRAVKPEEAGESPSL